MITKVDNISKIDQAIDLINSGADWITINPEIFEKANLDRIGSENVFPSGRLCLDISNLNTDTALEYIDVLKPGAIQVDLNTERLPKKRMGGVCVFLSSLRATYDDDPNWILSDCGDYENDFFQIDFLGDVEDSWGFWLNQSAAEELQISDVVSLSQQYPIIGVLDFNPKNLGEILSFFPDFAGIGLPLLPERPDLIRNDMHYFRYEEAIEIAALCKTSEA